LPRQLQGVNFKEVATAYTDKAIRKAMSPMPDNHLELNYFKIKVHFRCEPYISQSKNKHTRKLLASFRTGSHWLMTCKGRQRQLPIPYNQRLCPSCNRLEDEQHAIFDCYDYAAVRSKFIDLFKHGTNLVAFFTRNPVHRIALFLTACRSMADDRCASAPSRLSSPCSDFHCDMFTSSSDFLDTYDSD
ncbi:MAG: hypothetical protein ACRDRK_10850, partial [Pseudonocardia sp.]